MCLVCSTLFAKAQPVEQGSVLLDASYGYSTVATSTLRTAFTSESIVISKLSTGAMGPIAVRFEYMLGSRIGLGFEANYGQSMLNLNTIERNDYDVNAQAYTFDDNYYRYTFSQFRFMPKVAFHFTNSDNFDMYVAGYAGYCGTQTTLETNNPNYSEHKLDFKLSPLAARVATGMRLFLGHGIGLTAEFGYGGGTLVSGGISYRIWPSY